MAAAFNNATGIQRVVAGEPRPLEMGAAWERTRVDRLQGAKTWTGQGVYTHNLTQIAALTA